MGCDIHPHAERKEGGRWEKVVMTPPPFYWRSYGLFGFLAGVRNYSAVTPIAAPRGVPDDLSAEVREEYDTWGMDGHSASWLSVDELLAFDYDRLTEDRRCIRESGEPGEGKETTYREFLGPAFFDDLNRLKEAGAGRVVFWFDN